MKIGVESVMHTAITWGTNLVQTLLKQKLTPGTVAVDATMGNGHDTLFLAQLVGPTGKVYAFDIQENALMKTRDRLLASGIEPSGQVQLIQDGHQEVLKYVQEPIDAAMFNLGYLPGGDHTKVTQGETTIKALEGLLQLLIPGGIITLMIYHGHPGGKEEKGAVEAYLRELSSNTYLVTEMKYMNRKNDPPVIVVIEKV